MSQLLSESGGTSCTIIIVSYRRCAELLKCIQDLSALELCCPLDVVFVLQQFSQEELNAVRRESRSLRHEIYAFEVGIGVHRARNVGLQHATGDIIAFLDDDCRVAPDWVCAIMEPYTDAVVGGVGGFVRHPLAGGRVKRLMYRLGGIDSSRYKIDWGGFHSAPIFEFPAVSQDADWLSGVNMSFRRTAIVAVGKFDEAYGRYGFDDVDYSLRVRQAGWRIIVTPRATNDHYPSALNRSNIREQIFGEEFRRVRFVQKAIGHRRLWKIAYLFRFARFWLFTWCIAFKRRDPLVPWFAVKGAFAGLHATRQNSHGQGVAGAGMK